jgi:hypothetical protein
MRTCGRVGRINERALLCGKFAQALLQGGPLRLQPARVAFRFGREQFGGLESENVPVPHPVPLPR